MRSGREEGRKKASVTERKKKRPELLSRKGVR